MIESPVRIPPVVKSPAGLLEMNPLRSYVRSWCQGTDRASRVSIDGGGSADDTITVVPEEDMTGDFEITHFTSDHLGPYRLTIYVGGGLNQALMDVPIHVDLICGAADRPFYLPVSLFVNAGGIISLKFTNLATTITNKVRVKAHGRRFVDYAAYIGQKAISDQFWGRGTYPYFAGLNDTSLTLTSLQTGVGGLITIPSHADFEAEFLCGKSQGPLLFQLKESKSGRPIMVGGGTGTNKQDGIESSHIFGTAKDPYRFTPDPAIFRRRSLPQATFDDLSRASNQVEIALVGRCLPFKETKRSPSGPPRVANPVAA